MLCELRIKNLAIIDDLTVRFGKGLNILTGETGAGKSILIDSLSLALGSRAQSEFVRAGEKEAVVQAYFELGKRPGFPDIGLDFSDGLILRRSVSATGKSRAYINDSMVSLQSLAEIGKTLVDIHGQHEHQSLLSINRHRDFLDSFGTLDEEKKNLALLYHEVGRLRNEEDMLKQKMKEREKRIDILRFQIQEIEEAQLKTGEKDALASERAIAANLSRLNELTETAYALIYGAEDSCMEQLSSLLGKARELAEVDPSTAEIFQMLETGRPYIEDAAVALRKLKDRYDFEPRKLDQIEERLEVIRKLEKKYGEGPEQLMHYRDNATRELKVLELSEEKLGAIEGELREKEGLLTRNVQALSEKRRASAAKLEKLMKKELNELALENAGFVIGITQEALSAHGFDRVEFLFSANPGEPVRPLARIASGGELSRVMLALKSILADFDNTDVLIFDEVDAGIGGKTAESVGSKLQALSASHQVFCATHLPQIASRGDVHLKIEKQQRDKRVRVAVRAISGKEREGEIARMLSGVATEVSLRHAQELLEDRQ
ncbi:MAG: DNA repair protein RecN [Thermodesulfovibrionales bacterium]|nr:DNA repair protein RecN [Thermodesulfovibrionales bacterium]